jgi:hypothetical protein
MLRKGPIFAAIILACFAVGTALVNHNLEAARERPSVQRIDSINRLRRFALGFRAFLATHSGQWPERLVDVMREQRMPLGSNLVKGAGLYLYRRPGHNVPADWIVMWSETNHAAVPKGHQWGAEGEVASKDVPGVAYVLNASLQVEELTLEEFAKRSPSAAAARIDAVGTPTPSATAVGVPVPLSPPTAIPAATPEPSAAPTPAAAAPSASPPATGAPPVIGAPPQTVPASP